MCTMSDARGALRVIGSAEKDHDKLLQDCRQSVTIVHTGTTARTTGPTIFLLKGTKRSSCLPLLPADHTLGKREKYWTTL